MKPFRESENFTMVHNYLFDSVMPEVKPNSWKVLCCILRKTTGWTTADGSRKLTDQLSYSQLREGTGISSDATLRDALKELLEKKLVKVRKGKQWKASSYGLNWDYEASTTKTVVGSTTETVAKFTTETVDTKETRKEKHITEAGKTPQSETKEKHTRAELNALHDAITEEWKSANGLTIMLRQQMLGAVPKGKPRHSSNFDVPVTPNEVHAFAKWYRHKFPHMEMPTIPEKLQTHFYNFRASYNPSSKPETRVNMSGVRQIKKSGIWVDAPQMELV